MPWTSADVPEQSGRVFVITGANSGLGLESTRMIAKAGASVVMACRNAKKAEEAVGFVKSTVPTAALEVMVLDLSSLASVEAFAKELAERHSAIDVLVNNAGVMALPYSKTADGFEMQLGTNHLGHFALTSRLMPLLERSHAPRVVTVGSQVHRLGTINFDDLMGETSYSSWLAYCHAKLANLLFTFELERRLRARGKKSIAVAAHPGYASTNLLSVGSAPEGPSLTAMVTQLGNMLLAQSAEMGALPQVYAAVHPEVKGGQYIGPDGLLEMSGFPRVVDSSAKAKDEAVAAKLWEVSETLTRVRLE